MYLFLMRLINSVLVGLAALVGSSVPVMPAHAQSPQDIYVETPINGGDDTNDGIDPSTPIASVGKAILLIDGMYGPSTINLGNGIFNESLLGFTNFPVDIVGEGSDPSNPNNYTELNATILADAEMNIRDLASTGYSFGTGGFVSFGAGGSVTGCNFTEMGAIQANNNGEPVNIDDCTFGDMAEGVPAVYVESSGKSGGQTLTVTGSSFDNCSPAFRLGSGVNELNAGTDNMYLNCCDPIASAPYSVDTFVDLSGSYIECLEKSGEGTEGLCGPHPGITDLDRLEALVVGLPNTYFGETQRYPPRPRFAGDVAGDLDEDEIANYVDLDMDGDGFSNEEERAAGTDEYCFLDHPPEQEVPATSGLGLALGAVGLGALGAAYAGRRGKDSEAYSTEN